MIYGCVILTGKVEDIHILSPKIEQFPWNDAMLQRYPDLRQACWLADLTVGGELDGEQKQGWVHKMQCTHNWCMLVSLIAVYS